MGQLVANRKLNMMRISTLLFLVLAIKCFTNGASIKSSRNMNGWGYRHGRGSHGFNSGSLNSNRGYNRGSSNQGYNGGSNNQGYNGCSNNQGYNGGSNNQGYNGGSNNQGSGFNTGR